jgi:hypothetical protein
MKKHAHRFPAVDEITLASVCMRRILNGQTVLWLLMIPLLAGCSDLARRQATPLMAGLSSVIGKQNDPQLVRDGAPAYLLLADGFLETSPDDPEMLISAARLYAAYTSAFLIGRDDQRAHRLALKARDYAFRAAAIRKPVFGTLYQKPFAEFEPVADLFQQGDEALLLLVINTWAAVIQTGKDDWDLLADIAKIELLTNRLLTLDEGYDYGAAHLVMGVLQTLLPQAMGGRPEEGRRHFEKALQFSKEVYFPTYVVYAGQYAKTVQNRALYEQLLKHVIDRPADTRPELTLVNTLAQQRARQMMTDIEQDF